MLYAASTLSYLVLMRTLDMEILAPFPVEEFGTHGKVQKQVSVQVTE